MHKDAEHRITEAEEMEKQGEIPPMDETTGIKDETPPAAADKWFCMYRVLSLQEDFLTEQPMDPIYH